MYIPERTAVVMLQQRSYANEILDEFFDSTATKKSEVMANKAFLKRLQEHFYPTVDGYGRLIVEAIGPHRKIRSVLDIGCGMGWADLGLYSRLEEKPMLYLLDGSPETLYDDELRIAKRGYFVDYEFSFDVYATQQLLMGNGVRQEHINFVAPSAAAIENIRTIDLIMSFTSWFWHYPKEKYWDAVEKILHRDSILIVDTSGNRMEDLEFLRSKFRECKVLRQYEPGHRMRVLAKRPSWL